MSPTTIIPQEEHLRSVLVVALRHMAFADVIRILADAADQVENERAAR